MSDIELNRLGDITSIIGLVATIGGFVLALRQIRKTRSASESALEASESVRQQILQMNALQEITTAIRAFEDIRRLHSHKVWEVLPDRYTTLKLNLISIKGRTPNLSEGQKKQIQSAITQLSVIEGEVGGVIDGGQEPEIERINRIVSKQIEGLGYVLVEIQNNVELSRQSNG